MKNIKQFLTCQTIGSKLIISFFIVMILALGTSSFTSYWLAQKTLSDEMINSASSSVETLNSTVNTEMQQNIDIVDYFASQVSQANYTNGDNLVTEFKSYSTSLKKVESLYVGSTTGQFFTSSDKPSPAGYDPRERDWYKQALTSPGKAIITNPYISASTQKLTVTIAKQTADQSGVIGLDINLEALQATTATVKIGKEGYAFIVGKDSNFISHPTAIGEKNASSEQLMSRPDSKGSYTYLYENQQKELVYTTSDLTGWRIAGSFYQNEINEATQPILYKMVIVLLVSLIVGGIVVALVTRSITKRLSQIVFVAEAISDGDLTHHIVDRSKDEIGRLSHTFNNMNTSLSSLINSINDSVSDVVSSSEQLNASSEQTSHATVQITTAIEQFSVGNERQNKNVNQSAEQLTQVADWLQTVKTNSNSLLSLSESSNYLADSGDRLMQQTVGQIQHIDQSVHQANEVVTNLSRKSEEISVILQTINDIAKQTNLLSLNAAIEAARAGEHGKGFNVVAGEVQKLAEQSRSSSQHIENLLKEITDEIGRSLSTFTDIHGSVAEGMMTVQQAADQFQQLRTSSHQISSSLTAMNTLVQEVNGNAVEVAQSVHEISEISNVNTASTHEIAASAEEQLAAMEEITASAHALASLAENLQQEIHRFKTTDSVASPSATPSTVNHENDTVE